MQLKIKIMEALQRKGFNYPFRLFYLLNTKNCRKQKEKKQTVTPDNQICANNEQIQKTPTKKIPSVQLNEL